MNRYNGAIICLAYTIGLLSTGIGDVSDTFPAWGEWLGRILGISLITLLTTLILPRMWWLSPPRKIWLIAGLVAIFAVIYLELRTPYPSANDISQLVSGNKSSQLITIEGKVLSESRLNRKQNLQFWLESRQFTLHDSQLETSSGKLYVTLPNSPENRVYSGQEVTIRGLLYRPRKPVNPSAFDFSVYLARQGAFSGLKGKEILNKKEPLIGVWQIRERIVNAQIQGLGIAKGTLLSSIAIGRQAVDLPADIQDLFIKTGLVHVLAASGFQVTLLLGVVLTITRNLSPRKQFIISITVLIFYVALTGLQPSVMRAVVMGMGALIGIVYNRKVNRLGSLLVAGTLLLLFQPLWIWDLGFQLSFLATLGLIITLPVIQKKIDYLPSVLVEPIGITFAASIWTLPLLMYSFSSIALYSILTNVITTPLIIIISLGGVLSAFLALIYPTSGSLTAGFLFYPIDLLLQILTFFTHLPASTYSTGKLSLGIMIITYGLMGLLCIETWFQQRWYLVSLFIISLILIPIIYTHLTLIQVTVLATKSDPVIVIQNRGHTILVNGNEPETARYTVLPFLRQQGINQLKSAITLKPSTDWTEISNSIKIEQKIHLSKEKKITIGSINFQTLDSDNNLVQFQVNNYVWLWIINPKETPNISQKLTPLALLWRGKSLDSKWLEIIEPKTAIALTYNLSYTTRKQLKKAKIYYYQTGRDGAIQWTPQGGFQPFLEENSNFNS